MKMVSVRDLRTKPAEVWKDLGKEQDLVLTNNGKPIGIIAPANEEDLEDSLRMLRRLRAMRAVEQMQMKSLKAGMDKMTLSEVNAVIKGVRKARHS